MSFSFRRLVAIGSFVRTLFTSLPTLAMAIFSMAWAAHADEAGLIADGATVEMLGEGYSFTEGPAVDREGNVFFTDQPNDQAGKQLTNIPIPEPWTANVTFCGKDRRLLFVTASKKVYGVRMRVQGL